MYTQVKPFLLYAISSIHAGSGSDVGIVDLPIQREQHTGFPKIESSTLKGAVRSCCWYSTKEHEGEEYAKSNLHLIFGSEPSEAQAGNVQAGAIAFADARILLFPVKSMRGVFAWVTCPQVIRRLNYELSVYGEGKYKPLPLPERNTAASDRLVMDQHVVLDEYTIPVTVDPAAAELGTVLNRILFPYGEADLSQHLVVLDDDTFRDFVLLSTEVNARISIDSEKGTAEGKALWYEENVPPESVFYSFLFAGQVRGNQTEKLASAEQVMEFMTNERYFPSVFQLGGNSTLGRGMLKRLWMNEEGAQ